MASKIITIILILFVASVIEGSPRHGSKMKKNSAKNLRKLFNNPVKHLMGTILDEERIKKLPVKKHDADLIASLPETFDPREKWPFCPTLHDIRDQGCCGSCWAFAGVAAMTDRICIHSNGTKNFYFSAEDVVSCNLYSDCGGGSVDAAWEHWTYEGIVSGGPFNSSQGCQPYQIPPYKQSRPCPHLEFLETPTCYEQCEEGYEVSYRNDKHFGKIPYTVDGEDQIKAELFKNGPVEAAFSVHEDFLDYKSGVYSHQTGEFVYGHAVKIMGWGVEDGKKYWLVANSWSTLWGDKGFFKIIRGENHKGIERFLVAAEPVLDDM